MASDASFTIVVRDNGRPRTPCALRATYWVAGARIGDARPRRTGQDTCKNQSLDVMTSVEQCLHCQATGQVGGLTSWASDKLTTPHPTECLWQVDGMAVPPRYMHTRASSAAACTVNLMNVHLLLPLLR